MTLLVIVKINSETVTQKPQLVRIPKECRGFVLALVLYFEPSALGVLVSRSLLLRDLHRLLERFS